MKNIILLIVLFIQTIHGYSQSYDGIEVGKSLASTKSIILSKGFKPELTTSKTFLVYHKYVDGRKITLFVAYTPITKTVWKIVADVDIVDSWMLAKSKYLKYVGVLSNKYGSNIKNDVNFESPYYEGDGYEIQALFLNKAEINTLYRCQSGLIMLEMLSFEIGKVHIFIHYMNNEASDINDRELQTQNNKIY